MSTKKLYHIR